MKGSGWNCEDCGRPVFRWELLGGTDPDTVPPTYAIVENGKIILSFFEGIVAECTSEECMFVDHNMGFKGEKDLILDIPDSKIIDEGNGEEFGGEVKIRHKCGKVITIPDDINIETDMDKKRFTIPFKVTLNCPKCKAELVNIKGEISSIQSK